MRKDIVSIDFEASSLDLTKSYPIEIGWGSDSMDVKSHLIRPIDGWDDWDPKSQDVHKIQRQDLFRYGIDAVDVLVEFLASVSGKVLVSDSYIYDGYWLSRLFEAADMSGAYGFEVEVGWVGPGFKLIPIQRVIAEALPWTDQGEIFSAAKSTVPPTHRAGDDVRYLIEVLKITEKAANGSDPDVA